MMKLTKEQFNEIRGKLPLPHRMAFKYDGTKRTKEEIDTLMIFLYETITGKKVNNE